MMKTLTALFMLLATTLPAAATSLLPLSLEQLSNRAALIFYGEVVGNTVQKDAASGQIVTLTTFRVLDLIKGQSAGTHTIKQLGGTLAGSRQRLMVHGVPGFVPGREYVVFLPEKSRLGFCSPLGLHQGSFTVIEKDGVKLIGNGNTLASPVATSGGNSQVPLASISGRPSQARLDDFIYTVKTYSRP